jgi:two-component system, NtrC family, sensor kinase
MVLARDKRSVAESQAGMTKQINVLQIEDSKSDAALLVHRLRIAHYEVYSEQVETIDQLRSALEKRSWDVIIADYQLPEMDAPAGLALLQQMKIDTPYIIVSGTITEEMALAMMNAGAKDFISKRNMARLIAAIEREVQQARIREERRRTEKALAWDENLLQCLMDNIPDRIYFKDLQSRFSRISQSAASTFGSIHPGDVQGKTDFDFFTEEHARQAFEDEQQIIATGKPIIGLEEKETWPDGRITWANTSKMPMVDISGKIIGTFGISRDITERKIAEEALHLRGAALEAAANAIVITDQTGTIQWVNRAFTQLTGYSPAEVVQQNPRILKSGQQDVPFYQSLWNTILAGEVWHGELINQRKDGKLYHEEMSITPLCAQDGTINHFIAVKQDITARKAAECALLEEKEHYRSLFESVPVGIFRTAPDGRILMANPTLIHMLGYLSFEEMPKNALEEDGYNHGISQSEYRRRKESDGHVLNHEFNVFRKDGTAVIVRESGQVVYDESGKVLYYDGVLEDITQIRRSELQNLRLVAAFEQTAETVIVSDLEGKILYINPAFEKMFGITSHGAVGENIALLRSADLNPDTWKEILSGPQTGNVWRGDIRVNHAAGNALKIDATISPVLGLEKEISSLVFVMRDVTQDRMAEAQHRQSQKLEAIGQLAAGIAHEINTPTQFIGNNIRFLQTGFESLSRLIRQFQTVFAQTQQGRVSKELIQETGAVIQEVDMEYLAVEIPAAIDGSIKGVERVTKIVNAMKEFSHPGVREKTVTDINHAIENTITVSRNEWKYIAELTTDLAADLPGIPCLVDEFNQVILNLITNAADALRDSKPSRPEGKLGAISINTRLNGAWVEIRVSDNGTGIPDNIRDRVFDPFFTTKEVGRGTGQGLSISYDVIVNKHGGKISFETRAGEGTTFLIQLPLAKMENSAG